jgi:hypothetical protein
MIIGVMFGMLGSGGPLLTPATPVSIPLLELLTPATPVLMPLLPTPAMPLLMLTPLPTPAVPVVLPTPATPLVFAPVPAVAMTGPVAGKNGPLPEQATSEANRRTDAYLLVMVHAQRGNPNPVKCNGRAAGSCGRTYLDAPQGGRARASRALIAASHAHAPCVPQHADSARDAQHRRDMTRAPGCDLRAFVCAIASTHAVIAPSRRSGSDSRRATISRSA